MKAKQNFDCEEFKRGNVKECWVCFCGKHHRTKNGAETCCTGEKSKDCDCRHCVQLQES